MNFEKKRKKKKKKNYIFPKPISFNLHSWLLLCVRRVYFRNFIFTFAGGRGVKFMCYATAPTQENSANQFNCK